MPAICACRPFPPVTATKSPGFSGWCRIRCRSPAFRRKRFAATPPVAGDAGQSLIRTVIEAQCELLRISDRTDDFAGCAGAAARAAANALRHADHPQLADTVQRAGAMALAQHDAGPLLTALEQALVALADTRSTAAAEDVGGSSAGAASAPGTTGRACASRQRGENRGARQSGGRTRRCEKCAGAFGKARRTGSWRT